MPRYQVTAPDGRTVVLEGDSPPTDADLDGIFASLPAKAVETPAAAPAPAGGSKLASMGTGALSVLGGLVSGAAKEAPLVATRAASLPMDILSGAQSLLLDKLGSNRMKTADILSNEQKYKAREGIEAPFREKAGEGMESKVGRIAMRTAPTMALAGLTGGASIPAQMALGGASLGGQALAEGASPTSAALQGTVGAVTAGVAPKVAAVAKDLAPRVVNSLIKPLAKQFRFGRDPGRGIVNEGITALTRPQLAQQITGKLDELGQAIHQKLVEPTVAAKVIDIKPALAEVDRAIAEGAKRGEKALLSRLQDLRQALTHELDPVTGEWSIAKPTSLSPLNAHQLKRELGDAAKWTGQAFDNEVNQARVAVYRKLNELIDTAAPGTKALQARYADMLTAKSSLERAMTMGGRNNLLSLPDMILGAGGVAGGPVGALAGVGSIAARHLLGSAGGKTIGAQLLARFPNLSPALQAALRATLSGGNTATEGGNQ